MEIISLRNKIYIGEVNCIRGNNLYKIEVRRMRESDELNHINLKRNTNNKLLYLYFREHSEKASRLHEQLILPLPILSITVFRHLVLVLEQSFKISAPSHIDQYSRDRQHPL